MLVGGDGLLGEEGIQVEDRKVDRVKGKFQLLGNCEHPI